MARLGMGSGKATVASTGTKSAAGLGPNGATSTLEVSSNVLPNDNTTTLTATVTVLDANGVPISGVTPVVRASTGHGTVGTVTASGAAGTATCTYKSATAETVVLSATVGGYTVAQTQTITVNVVGGAPDLSSVDEVGTVAGDTRHFYGSGFSTSGLAFKNDNAGGTAWTSVTAVTDGHATAVAPADTAGAHAIYVVNDSGNDTLAAAVSYAAFYDNFESYTPGDSLPGAGAGNYGWNTGGNPSTCTVSTTQAQAGTKSLKCHFVATSAAPWYSRAEQRFQFGAYLTEVWLEYWLYWPDNYVHRTVPGYSDNHKFLILWRDTYGSGNGDFICDAEDWAGPDTNDSMLDGRTNTSTNGTVTHTIPTTGIPSGSYYVTDFFDASSPASGLLVPGNWHRVRAHIKTASAPGAGDGQQEYWIGSTAAYQRRAGDFWYAAKLGTGDDNPLYGDPTCTLHNGYVLGEANAGYAADTDFFIDGFRIYAVDPGWA